MAKEQLIGVDEWTLVAEVAEHYPRLLSWLAEGQVGALWNVFGIWLSVLRLIPVVRWLLWRFVFKRVAAVASWRVALYQSILQERRVAQNAHLKKAWEKEGRGKQNDDLPDRDKDPAQSTDYIPKAGISGLSAVSEEPVIVETPAGADLDARVSTITSGCVGISGLRGAGKSALIQDFCSHRYGTPRVTYPEPAHFLPGLRIMIHAPIRFDAREFLIHQYTCLCQAVLADVRFNPTTLTRQLLLPFTPSGRIRLSALFGALSGAIFFGACVVLAYLAYLSAHHDGLKLPDDLTNWEIAGAVATGIAGVVSVGWRTKRTAREVRQIVNLATDAEDRLQQLHYQRTDTRNAGGGLTGPMGASVSLGISHEFTQQLMTLPELIADYREFVQRVVGGLQEWEWGKAAKATELGEQKALGADVRLIIGIDQMDQIDDPEAACKFLAELSAEFGVPNCVYLLSIPTSTMSTVNQRMVPLKTSSPGVFDEMTWVEPFKLRKSAQLLSTRVVGLPPILVALCYVLSGGLPRELLRVARSVVRAVQDPEEGCGAATTDVIQAVMEDEVTALKHRTLASAVSSDASEIPGLMEQLTDEYWPWNTPLGNHDPALTDVRRTEELLRALQPAAEQRASLDDADTKARALAVEVRDNFIADLYYLLTVHGLFLQHRDLVEDNCRAHRDRDAPRWVGPEKPDPLVGLSQARITLGINPDLAAHLVTAVRKVLPKKIPADASTDDANIL